MKKIIVVLCVVLMAGCSTLYVRSGTVKMRDGTNVELKNGRVAWGDESAHYYSDGIYYKLRYENISEVHIVAK